MGHARFEKFEGLGNDFLVVEAADEAEVSAEAARAWCDRRRGVGGDGVLVILPARARGNDARMRVVNADGSIAEMCGNGLRCAALHLARRKGIDEGDLAVETDAGLRRCVIERRGDEAVVLCEMGIVRAEGDVTVDLGEERITLTRIDAGNPHAVAFRSITAAELEPLGTRVAASPVFTRGANVEFVRVDRGALDVLVWERGAGATLACGTGACAAVVAASVRGVLDASSPVRVRLPGGELEVRYDAATGRTSLRGPARRVFAGTLVTS